MGGITNADDALEFILAGATAVCVGSANFRILSPPPKSWTASAIICYNMTSVTSANLREQSDKGEQMEKYKEEFIEFMVDSEVLKFGDFVTKSGRKTPFFINTGFYRTGSELRRLGSYYAQAIKANFGTDFDILFGPAYKGIPLSVAASMAMSEMYGAEIGYCSNRKEIKDHGDKGILLGSPIKDGDRVVIIEDVTTAGTSVAETMPIIKSQAKAKVTGLVVSWTGAKETVRKGSTGRNSGNL